MMLLVGRKDSVLQDLSWIPQDQDFKFNPDHVSDVPVKATQRSHHMQLRNTAVNEISSTEIRFNPFNIS